MLEQGGRDGPTKVPLIQIGGERLVPNFGSGGCNITKSGNAIVISAKFEWEGNDNAYTRQGWQMGDVKTLTEFGISSMFIRFAIGMQRAANSITMQVHESTLRIVTT